MLLERRDVIGREPEAARPVRHRTRADRGRNRFGQRRELRLELTARQRRRIRVPPHVVGRARRCFPDVVVCADFAVTAGLQLSQHLCGPRIGRDRVGDDVGRAHAVTGEERVQPRQRVDVLERLIDSSRRVPLVVTFGVDADEQVH